MQQLQQLFIKDKKLPIHIDKSPYFEYFMDLYDPWLNTKAQYEMLMSDFNKRANFEDWYQHKSSITHKIQDYILQSSACSRLNSEEIDKSYTPMSHKFPHSNIFNREHVGKNLVSIDMVKANWQMWNLLGLTDNKTYEDFIKSFGASEYQASSKILRQVLFGEINPKRIQRMEKTFSIKTAHELDKNNYKILTCSADEMVIELQEHQSIEEIKEIVTAATPNIVWRFENWQLSNILQERNWVLQENLTNGKIDFRNVPKNYMPQVYKHYMGLPIEKMDLTFEYEGEIAFFAAPLVLTPKKRYTL